MPLPDFMPDFDCVAKTVGLKNKQGLKYYRARMDIVQNKATFLLS